MRYKIVTEEPKRGEDKYAAVLTVPDGRTVTGFGKDEQKAMIDAIRRLFRDL